MKAVPLAPLAIAILACPFAAAATTALELELETRSSLEWRADRAEFEDAAFSVRFRGDNGDEPLRFQAASAAIEISERHLAWRKVSGGPGNQPFSFPPHIDETEVRPIANGSLLLSTARPWSTLVFGMSRAVVEDYVGRVDHVSQDPYVADSSLMWRMEREPNPNERHVWRLDGTRLALGDALAQGTGTGAVGIYWKDATMRFTTASGIEELRSRGWSEQLVPGVSEIRHEVWYVATATNAIVHFVLPQGQRNVTTLHFAQTIRAINAETVAVNAATIIEGTLPESASLHNDTLWVAGELNGTFVGEGDAVRATVTGFASAYSVGGGPVHWPATVAVGSGLLVVVLLVWGRVVLDWMARLWGVAGAAKLEKHHVLQHEGRAIVHAAIPADAWIVEADLVTNLGLARGTLRYHVQMLQQHGKVADVVVAGRRYYVRREGPTLPPAPKDPSFENLALFVESQVETRPQRLGHLVAKVRDAYALGRSHVYETIRQMQTDGRLTSERIDGETWVRPSPAWQGESRDGDAVTPR
jgi:hypothetical protein